MSINYKVTAGGLRPGAADVNQYADTLSGLADVGTINLAIPIAAPTSAGTATVQAGTGLGVGVYVYSMTYVTGLTKSDGTLVVSGETVESATWSVTTTAGNQQVSHTALPVSPDVTVIGKRLYRTAVDGAQRKLVTTLTAVAATYTDVLADTSLGANVPTSNTTGTTMRDAIAKDLLSFAASNSLAPGGGTMFLDPFSYTINYTLTGPWREVLDTNYPNGHYYQADGGTSAVKWKVPFTGTGLALFTKTDTSTRTIHVSVDGGAYAALTALPNVASDVFRKQLAAGLTYGAHTVEFYVNEAVSLMVGGFEVVADASPRTDAGTAYVSGTRVSPAAATLTPGAIGTAKSRLDLIGVDNTGAVTLTAGTVDTGVKAYRLEMGRNTNDPLLDSAFYLEAADGRKIKPLHSNPTKADGAKIWRFGTWTIYAGSATSGGAYTHSNTTGDYVVIGFVGIGLDLIAVTTSDSGIVGVSIDGGAETNFDLYSASPIYQKAFSVASGLAYGYHQVKIRVTGTKNAASTNYRFYPDAFDVYVPQAPATPANTLALGYAIIMPTADTTVGAFNAARSAAWVRDEVGSGDKGIAIAGANWSINPSPTLSNGSSRANTNANTTDTLEFAFVGTAVRMIGPTRTDQGIYSISIDGGPAVNVDTYTAANVDHAIQYVASGLTFGPHTAKITTTNTKNASSTANTIQIDAFDVLAPIETCDVRTLSPVADQAQLLMDAHLDPQGNPHVQYLRVMNIDPWGQKFERNFRSEMSEASVTIATAGTEVTAAVTFNRAFTVPPKVYMTFSAWPGSGGYNNAKPTPITTTGFTYTGNSYATGTLSVYWIAVGY